MHRPSRALYQRGNDLGRYHLVGGNDTNNVGTSKVYRIHVFALQRARTFYRQ